MCSKNHPREINIVQQASLILAHVCAAISLVMVSWWAKGSSTSTGFLGGLDWSSSSQVFNWHPVLMVAGMVFAFTEAVLTYRTMPFEKKTNKAIHLAWQTVAIVLISVGLRAAFVYHAETEKPDLWSLHAWLGIAVIVLFSANYVVGVLAFFFQVVSETVRAEVLPYHVMLGVFLYVTSIFTAESGIIEKMAFMNVCTSGYPSYDSSDWKSIDYYYLASGCKVANWLGIFMMLTALFGVLAVSDIGLGPRKGYALIPHNADP